uniref:Uncharacterized protein n=1 Tax=Aegilops tauschii subsp. strangulata TaxID=200361 RepID=A0A453MPA6_AEGTS
MGVGMGSRKKVIVSCAVLGLALLVVGAAAKDLSYCGEQSHVGLAAHGGTKGDEARGGGGIGLLAMPVERAGHEDEEKAKRKQEDAAVHQTIDNKMCTPKPLQPNHQAHVVPRSMDWERY